MKKLLMDAGNSSTKCALLEVSTNNNKISKIHRYTYEGSTPLKILSKIFEQNKTDNVDEVILVSVLGDEYTTSVKKICESKKLSLIHIQSTPELAGITNAYQEAYKLGTDRLVAIVGAYHLNKNQASIVIDSGTATTIDAVDEHGYHLGGLILPGLNLCSQSLLKNTKMLVERNNSNHTFKPKLFAIDTKQAITSGSLFGLVGAIKNISLQMENEIKHNSPDCIVNKLICGGAADELLPYLDKDFKHQENLLMYGLKIIFEQTIMEN